MKKMVVIVSALLLLNCPYIYANKTPTFTNNLGGMPISCSVYEKQVAVNGIATGYTMEMVRAVLGKPDYVSSKNPLSYSYNGMSIKFVDFGGSGKPIVYDISVWKDGVTFDGIKIGMSESELTRVYGSADNVHIEKNIAPKLNESQNQKYIDRLDKTVYIYNANACLNMAFVVKSGIIKEIHIHLSD